MFFGVVKFLYVWVRLKDYVELFKVILYDVIIF